MDFDHYLLLLFCTMLSLVSCILDGIDKVPQNRQKGYKAPPIHLTLLIDIHKAMHMEVYMCT